MTPRLRLPLLLACAAVLAGCEALPRVEAWEKGTLSRPAMRFDADRIDALFTDHIYTSKEGALGGRGVGGGGCGCN